MLKNLNFFCELNLGLILTAVGIVYFKNPNHFAFGGTSGLSILLADLFPRINVGGFMWIINIVLVVLGFIFLGVKCMGWTIYSSFALSFFVSGCEWLYPSGVSLSGDAMLDLVFAVFLPALGAAIVFDIGASTGGTDIVALILAKYDETFRCLAACKKAIRKGGLGPCAANGANEEAVRLFLEDKIGFLDIGRLVEAVVDSDSFGGDYTLSDVYECDRMAREFVRAHL